MNNRQPTLQSVRAFWEKNPVAANAIPFEPGTAEYFEYYDRLREANESVVFSAELHEYAAFKGKKVLDVGSGNGYVLSRYALHGAHAHGVDLTERAIGLCRRRFAMMGLPGRFIVGNAECLPFQDASFDCVCSMGVLHHTPDTRRSVDEVFRVLRPGGRIILMFYHRHSFHYRVKFPLLKWLKGVPIQQSVNLVDGVGNPKGDVYSRVELRRLLENFDRLDLSSGWLPWHAARGIGRLVPTAVREHLERRWGWFLYAKGIRPVSS